jgi:hypothetical protein
VDAIHKRFGNGRHGEIVQNKWSDYFLVPENLEEEGGIVLKPTETPQIGHVR